MTVVLYSQEADPLVTALKAGEGEWSFLHVDELVDRLRVKPWPTILDIIIPGALSERIRGMPVVNRLFSFEGTACLDKLAGARVNERWLHARLDSLLASASALAHDTGVRGISRSLLPLNAQWFCMRTAQDAVSIPHFSYATGFEESNNEGLGDPMQKSIWSLFDWKTERHLLPSEARRHRFFVDRPRGMPLISFFAGKQSPGWVFPRETTPFDHHALNIAVQAARRVFMSDVGEMLFYVQPDGSLVFHAFSPHLLSAAKTPGFSAYISGWQGPAPHPTREPA